ncbi:MAG TPA: ABC transporter permease subunit [Clostridiaceae bacterium]|nr:ABC transporter permease subunit [Clostridiaceae bacterium]
MVMASEMIIFIRELKRNRKSFIIWTASLVLFNIMIMSLFPSIADNTKMYDEMIKEFPKGIIEVFGLDKISMFTILGFFGTESYLFITLFGSIYAMLLGASILSKEESEKTIEFLLAKPVTRSTIVTAKAANVFFYITLFNLIFSFTNYLMFEAVKKEEYSLKALLMLSAGPWLLHLTFAAIGLLISVFVVKAKSVYPVSIGFVLVMYFINVMSSISEKLTNLKYFTPFKYVDAPDIIINEKIEPIYLIIMLIIITVSIAATYVLYNRKNM